jgi:nicotinate-nucleotide adenylyltransferase
LDRLLVIPTGQAWHKARPLTAAHHRLAMARLCFGDLPQVQVDSLEIERVGPSYTIDTLRTLKDRWPDAQLFLLMGEDQARALNQWRDGQQIPQFATICVAEREDPTRSGDLCESGKPLDERFLRLPVAPMAVSDATAFASRSCTISAWPAFTRRRAMTPPIFPRPMKPSFMTFLITVAPGLHGLRCYLWAKAPPGSALSQGAASARGG